jgi:hypothetical protein
VSDPALPGLGLREGRQHDRPKGLARLQCRHPLDEPYRRFVAGHRGRGLERHAPRRHILRTAKRVHAEVHDVLSSVANARSGLQRHVDPGGARRLLLLLLQRRKDRRLLFRRRLISGYLDLA